MKLTLDLIIQHWDGASLVYCGFLHPSLSVGFQPLQLSNIVRIRNRARLGLWVLYFGVHLFHMQALEC